MDYKLYHGDCLDVMKTLADESITGIVTDPPYGLSFMGKDWDHGVPGVAFWQEMLRIIKLGGFLLSFGGTRTFHRLTCAIEDAGWEIRDCIMWVYGSGFPKSMAIDKAIDKHYGEKQLPTGKTKYAGFGRHGRSDLEVFLGNAGEENKHIEITEPTTPLAKAFDGYGTALKPAWEPIIVAMKPVDKSFANNAIKHGVAGLNIDECRIGTSTRTNASKPRSERNGFVDGFVTGTETKHHEYGRFPANLIHDGSEEVLDDLGSPARFFYAAKASRSERNDGLEGMPEVNKWMGHANQINGSGKPASQIKMQNFHPTVKPKTLMIYLCKLLKQPSDTILMDPFMGSGTTGVACAELGVDFIGIERESEYLEIAEKRIAAAKAKEENTTTDLPLFT